MFDLTCCRPDDGHYRTIRKEEDGRCYKFDDVEITEIFAKDISVEHCIGCLVFYLIDRNPSAPHSFLQQYRCGDRYDN